MKAIAIVQSNYVPWKGYFDLIAAVDEFILYDDMQYTRRDWRNRNKIKTPRGEEWLTIPVKVKGNYHQPIRETLIDGTVWRDAHWKALKLNYGRAACFQEIADLLAPLYHGSQTHLSQLNRDFIQLICKYLGIGTLITDSADYDLVDGKSDRLAQLVTQAGGSMYVSGPAARDYLDTEAFVRRNIAVQWFDYSGYEPYPQLWGDFVHGVSILDLLFNCGLESPSYMKHVMKV